VSKRRNNPYDHQSIGSKSAQEASELVEALAENLKFIRVLRTFLKWYDGNERNWDGEFRATTEFFDLQEIADRARAVLAS